MKRGAPWYKRYPDDYIKGTRKLSLEARGAYSDILDMLYMSEGEMADDRKEIAAALRISVRKWEAVRKELIANGKLDIENGMIVNSRARAELENRRSQARVNRETALGREKQKRDKSQNTKKNNDCDVRTVPRNEHHAHACTRATETDTESDTERIPATVEQEPARDGLACLNGAADLMIRDVVGWMDRGDEVRARNWLARQIEIYGQNPTKDAWSKMKTDMDTGSLIARPLQAWCKIAQSMRDSPRGTMPRSGKPTAMEIINRKIAEAESAGAAQ